MSRKISEEKKNIKLNFLKKLEDFNKNRNLICDSISYLENKLRLQTDLTNYYDSLNESRVKQIRNDRITFIKKPTKILIEYVL
jgi:hypothetical protein